MYDYACNICIFYLPTFSAFIISKNSNLLKIGRVAHKGSGIVFFFFSYLESVFGRLKLCQKIKRRESKERREKRES
jgi:hypothetical protein